MSAPTLPRWPVAWPHAWLAPVLAAATWSIVLAGTRELSVQRSLVFLGGPLVLLAGLHARLGEYLHGRARERLAALPVAPARHFRAGAAEHRRGLAIAAVAGTTGLAIGAGAAGEAWRVLVLAGDFAWLCVMAALVEPLIPAVSALAGQRFPEAHWVRQAQRGLGGGWTTPEATVHLYAPALGLALAISLAMPGQLALALVADGRAWTAGLAGLLAVPLALAIGGRIAAPRLYAGGFFAAVAWLAEATRSLAGPPEPPPRPAWVLRLASPVLRLWATQWLRLTALPVVRVVALLAWTAYLGLRAAAPTAPTIALGLGLAALWLSPLQTLARQRRRNAALLVRLPVRGSPVPAAVLAFGGPVLVLMLVIGGRLLAG